MLGLSALTFSQIRRGVYDHSVFNVDVGDVLGEFRLLIAISGVLFGFLLNVSVFKAMEMSEEVIFLILAIVFSAASVMIFFLPVVYHHSKGYPGTPEEKRKFYIRSHRFALFGLVTLILTLYFSLSLVFFPLLSWNSLAITALILIIPAAVYWTRRIQI